MAVLIRVQNLIRSGDVANLELLAKEKRTSLGDIKPIYFGDCLGLINDLSADLLLPKSTRSQMNVGAKEAVYPAMYIYKLDLELYIEIAMGLPQVIECNNTESRVWIPHCNL